MKEQNKKSPEMVVLVMTPLEVLTVYSIIKFESEKAESSRQIKELEASLLKKMVQSVSLEQMDDCIAELEVIKLLNETLDEE